MTSEMVRRLQKHLDPWIVKGEDGQTVPGLTEAQVKSLLRQMRNPTGAMLRASCGALSPSKRPTAKRISTRKKHRIRWQAMIDTAINERPRPSVRERLAEEWRAARDWWRNWGRRYGTDHRGDRVMDADDPIYWTGHREGESSANADWIGALDALPFDVKTPEDVIRGVEVLQAQFAWRAIETAPKDRTPILIEARLEGGSRVITTVWWIKPQPGSWADQHGDKGKWEDRDGRYESPLHWMPLPEAPK